MTFTVGSLLAIPEIETVSLTPGVGEDRLITWAHVSELLDPWTWLGTGVLVMTTGIHLPASTDEQCEYLKGMHAAGIAAVMIDAEMAAAPFTEPALAYAASIGFPVLSVAHHVKYASVGMVVAQAVQRGRDALVQQTEQRFASLLLTELCTGAIPASSAARLLAPHGVQAPFLVAVAQSSSVAATQEGVREAFDRAQVPSLTTVEGDQVLILASIGGQLDSVLDSLADEHTRIGASSPAESLEELPNALVQARSALIRNQSSGRVLRFEAHEATSLFLPADIEQMRNISQQVLGPLRTYDAQRGTSLTQTLRVFLEENRSWVRAAERLFVHRQTLIARVSRIEKIIDRDLSSIEDTAECWLAVQAAIGCGDLDPNEVATGEAGVGTPAGPVTM